MTQLTFDLDDAVADLSCNRRTLTWTVLEPGKIGNAKYQALWVTVGEREAFSNELTAWEIMRRPNGDSFSRERMPKTATETIKTHVRQLVGRRFDDIWWRQWRTKSSGFVDAVQYSTLLEARAGWVKDQATVTALVEDGDIEVRRHRHEGVFPTRRWDPFGGGRDGQPIKVAAELVLQGECLGWMLANGHIVPDVEWPK